MKQVESRSSRDPMGINIEKERARADSAEKMRNQIDQIQKVVDAYDASGIYDDTYLAYKFTLDEAQRDYDRKYADLMSYEDIDKAEQIQKQAAEPKKTKNLMAVNVENERARIEAAAKKQEQIKQIHFLYTFQYEKDSLFIELYRPMQIHFLYTNHIGLFVYMFPCQRFNLCQLIKL